jgi:N-acetylglucosamine malate deacetylase 1
MMGSDAGLDILVFGAHPDDAEIGMGGTIYKHAQAGLRVGICDLTLAEMSSNGTIERRKAEAAEAGGLLGLAERSNLQLPDRGLRLEDHQIAIVREIRRLRPRIVFAPYWIDRHPDHVLCGRLVEEAVFSARLRKFAPDLNAHKVDRLYFYYINDVHEPQLVVDVTDAHERKMEALAAYRSQFDRESGEVATPINQGFLEGVEARDRALGHASGFRYAEGFATRKPYEVHLF